MIQQGERLTEVLNLGAGEHIALVGGGGKTTLSLKLAQEMRAVEKRVIFTTTTKVWVKEGYAFPHLTLCSPRADLLTEVCRSLKTVGHFFLAREILDSGKLSGISPTEADLIYRRLKPDHMVVEADGAAGRPLKAPAGHEPVIPSSTTVVIAVMGLEPLARPLDQKSVFRFTEFERITGLREGQRLSSTALAKLFQAPEGLYKGAPESATRIVFMNKSDLCNRPAEAEHLASILVKGSTGRVDRVVMGSLHTGIYTAIPPSH